MKQNPKKEKESLIDKKALVRIFIDMADKYCIRIIQGFLSEFLNLR